MISVVSHPFEAPVTVSRAVPQPPDLAQRVEQFQRPVLSVLGIVALVLLGLLTLNALRASAPVLSASTAVATLPSAHHPAPVAAPSPGIGAPVHVPAREKAVASVGQHPDAAARMMKAWLKDG
jgi:uncharacterized iron-regulated membrane protein